MIVQELIKELEKLPQDKTILARGYENGWNDIENVYTETLVKCDGPWYDGIYQEESSSNIPRRVDTPKEYICLI